MGDLVILFILLVVLAIVTVVGHAIWLLLAWFFRVLAGTSARRPPTPRRPAPPPSGEPPGGPLDEFDTTSRRLAWLWEKGLLERETYEDVRRAVDAGRTQVRGAPGLESSVVPRTEDAPATEPPALPVTPPPLPVPGEAATTEVPPPLPGPGEPPPATAPSEASPAARPARRSFGEMLAAFMEEKNIRWGELVGGMLIVFCSIALVINLWGEIGRHPFLKFFLPTAVTAVFLGAGLYTEHRWKLPETSRGVLIVGTLLIPLTFLAIVAFSTGGDKTDRWLLAGEGTAVVVFSVLGYLAARVVAAPAPLLSTLGVMGSSSFLLVLSAVGTAAPLWLLGGVPVAIYGVTTALVMTSGRRRDVIPVKGSEAGGYFTFLGGVAFAAALALGLLAHGLGIAAEPLEGLRRISPFVSLFGIPTLAAGLFLRQRLDPAAGHHHLAATSIAVLGALINIGGLLLAWPDPVRVLVLSLSSGALFSALAFWGRKAAASWLAVPCWSVGYSLGFLLLLGHVVPGVRPAGELVRALLGEDMGAGLMPLALVLAGAGLVLRRRGRTEDGRIHLSLGLAAAVLSLALASYHGLGRDGDPLGVTWIYLAYSAVAGGAAWFVRSRVALRDGVVGVGLVLLFLALVQFLAFRLSEATWVRHPVLLALLVHATLTTVAASWSRGGSWSRGANPEGAARFVPSLSKSSAIASGVAAIHLVVVFTAGEPSAEAALCAVRGLWLAVIWFALALIVRSPPWLSAAHLAATFAAAALAVRLVAEAEWFGDAWVIHPLTLQAIGIAVGLLHVATFLARGAARRYLPAAKRSLLQGEVIRADHIVLWWISLTFLGLVGLGTLDLVLRESLGNRVSDFAPSLRDGGNWLLWGVLLGAILASLWESFSRRQLVLLYFVASAACFLASAAGAGKGWSHYALHWSLALFYVLSSLALWGRSRLAARFLSAEQRTAIDVDGLAALLRRLLLLYLLPAGWFALVATARRLADPSGYVPPGPVFGVIGETASYLLPLLLLAVALVGHAIRERWKPYLYAAGVFIHFIITFLWLTWSPLGRHHPVDLVAVNAVFLALTGLGFLSLEAWVMGPAAGPRGLIRYHVFALLGAAGVFGALLGLGLAGDALGAPDIGAHDVLLPALLVTSIALGLTSVRVSSPRAAPVALYLLALGMPLVVIDRFDLEGWQIAWAFAISLALHGFLFSLLWSRSRWLHRLLLPLRGPDGGEPREEEQFVGRFLAGAGTLQAWIVLGLSLVLVLTLGSRWIEVSPGAALFLRLGAALLVPVSAASLLFLPPRESGEGGFRVRGILVAGVLGPLLLGWAWIDPGSADAALHRSVVALVVAAGITWVNGVLASRAAAKESRWSAPLRNSLVWITGLFAIALAFVFLLEGREFLESRDAVSVHPVAIAAVFLALALEIVALLAAALVPRRDALHLSERGRRACVYGAEALLALTVAHARVTMPWLFHGFISRYWPFVVMAIAYLGIGLSAMFRRQGRSVLAEPLDRTAIFLPVVPVIGFWVVGPEAYQVHYSWVLVFVGVLYGFLSLARKSVLFGLLATAASNGALWYLWSRAEGLGFAEHPQVWLAPLALSVLGASYLNRRQIPEPRQATIRYTCLMFLYLSSTADIFVAGVAESPWLPMVLAVWSVLGVFAGILLRVRSYLFAGSTFLLISLVTLVWHAAAAQGWTWLWYVAGIALGLGIIVFFALFERRRAEMVRLIDGLKEWDA